MSEQPQTFEQPTPEPEARTPVSWEHALTVDTQRIQDQLVVADATLPITPEVQIPVEVIEEPVVEIPVTVSQDQAAPNALEAALNNPTDLNLHTLAQQAWHLHE